MIQAQEEFPFKKACFILLIFYYWKAKNPAIMRIARLVFWWRQAGSNR